jgi:Ca2+:H+ antiporter
VFAAVWHAEVVAHRLGEPFGTLVLALAVTIIEVALIVSVMLAGKAGSETLARDTAFATIMIILNGIVGLGLLLGGVLPRRKVVAMPHRLYENKNVVEHQRDRAGEDQL